MDCHAAFAMSVLAPKSPLVKTSNDTPLSSFCGPCAHRKTWVLRVAGGWIMPTRTDVQTDVHIMPVDSDTPIHNLLKVQTVRCALVLYEGN